MYTFLLVACGGGLGAVLRYACTTLITLQSFPLATLLVNSIGCFCIGLVAGSSVLQQHPAALAFIAVGILGGFTTFSTFSLEAVHLFQQSHALLATLTIVLNITVCLASTSLGMWLVGQ